MVRISEVSPFWLEEGAPIVAIAGCYLKEFGFRIGAKVVIDITKGQIVVKIIDGEDGGV